MATNDAVLGDISFSYPRVWGEFYEKTPPSVIWAEKLTACNRGVELTGCVESALAEGIAKSARPETTNLKVQYDFVTRNEWKSQVDWGEDLMSKCIDFDMSNQPLVNAAPIAPVDTGESTVVPALDRISKTLDRSPIGQAVKAAADLAALCKYANTDWLPVLRYIESRWGLEAGFLDSIISPAPIAVSAGRLSASVGSRTSMTYGLDNLFGRTWIVPTGLVASNFLTQEEEKEGYIAAVDFTRMAEYAKFIVQVNAISPGVSGDHFRKKPGIFDLTVTAAFPTKHKISDYGLNIREYPSGVAYEGEVQAIKEAAGYLTDASYVKSVLAVYGLLSEGDADEGMYGLADLRRLRATYEQKGTGTLRAPVQDIKEVIPSGIVWGPRLSAATSRRTGVWTRFTEAVKDQKAVSSSQKIGFSSFVEIMSGSIDLKPDGRAVRPVKSIRNRLKLAKCYNDYISKGSYLILDKIARSDGSSGADQIESCGYGEEKSRGEATIASWLYAVPDKAYAASMDMKKKAFNEILTKTNDIEAPVLRPLRPAVRAANIVKGWHGWYTGRIVALKELDAKQNYAKLIKFQAFAHLLENCKIAEEGDHIRFPDLTELILTKIKKYCRRLKVALPYDEVADFFEEAVIKTDTALNPELPFGKLYDDLQGLVSMTTTDVLNFSDQSVSPHKFVKKFSKAIAPRFKAIAKPAAEPVVTVDMTDYINSLDLSFLEDMNAEMKNVAERVLTEEEAVYSLAAGLAVPKEEVNKYIAAMTDNKAHDYKSGIEAGFTLTRDLVSTWFIGQYSSIVDIWEKEGYHGEKVVDDRDEDVLS